MLTYISMINDIVNESETDGGTVNQQIINI